jgi:hypothetical protein
MPLNLLVLKDEVPSTYEMLIFTQLVLFVSNSI